MTELNCTDPREWRKTFLPETSSNFFSENIYFSENFGNSRGEYILN